MVIEMSCSCGKDLRLDESFADKTIRCPDCGIPLVVPEAKRTPSVEVVEEAEEVSTPPASTPIIRFHCACGKGMQATQDHVGDVVSCPACGEEVLIPESSRPLQPATTNVTLPQRRRKWRAKAPLRRAPFVAGLLALLVVIGGAITAWYLQKDQTKLTHSALIPDDAIGVVSIRLSDLWDNPIGQSAWSKAGNSHTRFIAHLQQTAGFGPSQIERVTAVYHTIPSFVDWIIFSTKEPYDRGKLERAFEQFHTEPVKRHTYQEKELLGPELHNSLGLWCVNETTFVLGSRDQLEQCITKAERGARPGPLTRTRSKIRTGDADLIIGYQPTRRLPIRAGPFMLLEPTVLTNRDEFTNALFAHLDLGKTGRLRTLKKLRLVTIEGRLEKTWKQKAILEFTDDLAARTARKENDSSNGIRVMKSTQSHFGYVDPNAGTVAFEQEGKRLHITREYSAETAIDRLTTYFNESDSSLPQLSTPSKKHLTQIVWALITYARSHGANLPTPAILGKRRTPLLSWRVEILPHLGETTLYNAINKQEPWDSEHNKQFWNQMPEVFAITDQDPSDGQTYFQVFNGRSSAFPGRAAVNGFQIRDPSAQTILVAESAQSVPWMAPKDIGFVEFPWGFPPTRLGGHEGDFFYVATCSGQVVRVPHTVSGRSLQAAITISKGDRVGGDFFGVAPDEGEQGEPAQQLGPVPAEANGQPDQPGRRGRPPVGGNRP